MSKTGIRSRIGIAKVLSNRTEETSEYGGTRVNKSELVGRFRYSEWGNKGECQGIVQQKSCFRIVSTRKPRMKEESGDIQNRHPKGMGRDRPTNQVGVQNGYQGFVYRNSRIETNLSCVYEERCLILLDESFPI